MKKLIDFHTLVQLRLSLRALYQLHDLLHTSNDTQTYTELLYEKIHIELDRYIFKAKSSLSANNYLEVFVVIVRLLNHKLDFDLFLSMFIMNMYELEYLIIYKNHTLNKVRLKNLD